MDPVPTRHRLTLLAAGLLLALTAGYGVLSGVTESGGETLGQRIAGWAELGYGALAVGGRWSGRCCTPGACS